MALTFLWGKTENKQVNKKKKSDLHPDGSKSETNIKQGKRME